MDCCDIGVCVKVRFECVFVIGCMDWIVGVFGDFGCLGSEVGGEFEQWQLLIECGVEEEWD